MNLPHREVMREGGLLVTYGPIRCQSRLHREPEGLLGRNGDEGVKVRGDSMAVRCPVLGPGLSGSARVQGVFLPLVDTELSWRNKDYVTT